MPTSKKRRLSKTSTVYIVIGVTLITLMTIVGTSAFLRVKDIVIEGASMYTAIEVVESSGISTGDNLMFIDSPRVSSKIREELPFVSEVEVRRLLPDTVSIVIVESVAVASVTFAGEVYIIDSSGRVLSRVSTGDFAVSEIYEDLIEIRGAEIEETAVGNPIRPVFGAEIKLQYMQDILEAAEREGHTDDMTYLDVSNIINVHFGYMGRYRVILGGRESLRPGNLRHNFGRLNETVSLIIERHPNTSGDIDLSDESGSPKFTPT